jgi:hypothetical protein
MISAVIILAFCHCDMRVAIAIRRFSLFTTLRLDLDVQYLAFRRRLVSRRMYVVAYRNQKKLLARIRYVMVQIWLKAPTFQKLSSLSPRAPNSICKGEMDVFFWGNLEMKHPDAPLKWMFQGEPRNEVSRGNSGMNFPRATWKWKYGRKFILNDLCSAGKVHITRKALRTIR